MTTKITLITPPDIFQNNQESVMLIDVTEQEQDEITLWLNENTTEQFNVYFYQGEQNVPWFLHSLACSAYKYINLANLSPTTSYLVGYVLAKNNVFYYTDNINVSELYSHINMNRVKNITEFLERLISGKK